MEKHKKYYFLLIPVIFIFMLSLVYWIQCRTVLKNIGDISESIFVPTGIADKYSNLLKFSIDEHIMWQYQLSTDEKEKMEKDVNNGIWSKMTEYDSKEISHFFTVNLKSYWPANISKNLYYCLYDFSLKQFIKTDSDVAILGWRRVLFVYDKENVSYYCVLQSV